MKTILIIWFIINIVATLLYYSKKFVERAQEHFKSYTFEQHVSRAKMSAILWIVMFIILLLV